MAGGESLMVNVLNDTRYPLNLTTTRMPQVDIEKNLLTINLDGTFFDMPFNTNHVGANKVSPQRLAGFNSN